MGKEETLGRDFFYKRKWMRYIETDTHSDESSEWINDNIKKGSDKKITILCFKENQKWCKKGKLHSVLYSSAVTRIHKVIIP